MIFIEIVISIYAYTYGVLLLKKLVLVDYYLVLYYRSYFYNSIMLEIMKPTIKPQVTNTTFSKKLNKYNETKVHIQKSVNLTENIR